MNQIKSNVQTANDKTQNDILEEESRKEQKCKLCDKVFKSGPNLSNHDKKFHMKKGTTTYKCDNCNEKLVNKINLENHISKEHITCNLCMKIFPTLTSLNDGA